MIVPYPKGEEVWVSYYNEEKVLTHIVTSKPSREQYFLYKLEKDKFVKVGRAKTPSALEKFLK